MPQFNRLNSAAVNVRRSRRNHVLQHLGSLKAGKCVPLKFIPLLREDACSASFQVGVEMMETAEILANRVNVRVTAYVVPLLAMARFNGSRDEFDRSYMDENGLAGAKIPFVVGEVMGAIGAMKDVYKYAGLHAKATDEVNTMYLEAYNLIYNMRAENRSPDITKRLATDGTLANAFWDHTRFDSIVPDFDQAMLDGEVALRVLDTTLGLTGTALVTTSGTNTGGNLRKASDGTLETSATANLEGVVTSGGFRKVGGSNLFYDPNGTLKADLTSVTAELQASNIVLTLSAIDKARRTQAWAAIREKYQGIDEEWLVDMLLMGMTIPDQDLKRPILLAEQNVFVGQSKRFATDYANIAQSAVSGAAQLDMRLRVPRLNTGGVIVIQAEAVPEQLFERQADPFFMLPDNPAGGWLAELPDAVRDDLDEEKVDVILNGEIDVQHVTPTGVFGYAPLNWKWTSFGPTVGGKFYRPLANTATDTFRQRIWSVENTDPTLSEDFFVVTSMHVKPFLDLVNDPFEVVLQGNAVIEGNTVFGGVLQAADESSWGEVRDMGPATDRIVKTELTPT